MKYFQSGEAHEHQHLSPANAPQKRLPYPLDLAIHHASRLLGGDGPDATPQFCDLLTVSRLRLPVCMYRHMMEYVSDLRGVIDGQLCFRANSKPTTNISLDLPSCSAILKRPSDAWKCQNQMMRQLTPTLPAAGRGRVVTATTTHARVKSIHDLTRPQAPCRLCNISQFPSP